MTALATAPMAKKRPELMTRILPDALEAAKLAAVYRGLTLTEYISEVVKVAAERDIEEGHARRKQARPKTK